MGRIYFPFPAYGSCQNEMMRNIWGGGGVVGMSNSRNVDNGVSVGVGVDVDIDIDIYMWMLILKVHPWIGWMRRTNTRQSNT